MAKSFSDMVNDVYTITNRADLVNETALAVRAATLKAHHSDMFFRDLFEITVIFQSLSYTHSFNPFATIPRWRAANFLRKVNSDGSVGNFLSRVSPRELLDSYNVTRTDVYYIAGLNLNINSSTEINAVITSCYRSPDVTDANYSSWIANDYPYAIIYEAAATVFKSTGYLEEEASFRRLSMEEIGRIVMANVELEGS